MNHANQGLNFSTQARRAVILVAINNRRNNSAVGAAL